jgi:tRNA dimethylallyltransferase
VVINADASQVYRDLRLLTARPSTEDEARVPHHLFGHIDGADSCSAARWAAEARYTIDAVHADGRMPILVGGSGLYIRTLLDGIAPVPPIDPAIREEVRAMPVAKSHAALQHEDGAAAQRLRPTDTTRVARALEVVRSTGRPLAAWQTDRIGGIGDRVDLAPLVLLPEREALFERCDARLREMFDQGAVAEVAALSARTDVPLDAPVLRAIGVREITAMLDGAIERSAAIAETQLATRRYAKRQYTWFRHQPPTSWPRTDELPFDRLKYYFKHWP